LLDTAHGAIPETPKATHPAFAHVNARVVANNSVALNAAAAAARRHGFTTVIHEQPLTGDAAAAGARVADLLLAVRDAGSSSTSGNSASSGAVTQCHIWGGETTVSLRGPAPAGGRCQEMALAASKQLTDAGDRGRGITILAAGTDGRDGPTDAAGAIVDASTWPSISATGRDAAASLRAHESYEALKSANALFSPGLSGTNVMDVTIGLVIR
jgi:glycerate-2-kinase